MLVDQPAGSVPSISDDVCDAVSKSHLSSRRRQVSLRPYGSTVSATSFSVALTLTTQVSALVSVVGRRP